MAARRHDRREAEQGLDLTPMLDIVFIMLIFFIVTTSFVREAGVQVNRPQAASAEKQAATSVYVAVTAQGEIWVDRRPVTLSGLRAAVARIRLENPEATGVIQADADARHGLVVDVMDELRLAGVREIAVSASAD
ncbi:MAG: biopolymer transporter ExbD [Oceanococcaceae bacterium]